MYICLKNNNLTQEIIDSLKTFGEEVIVRTRDCVSFIEVDTDIKSTISAIVVSRIDVATFKERWYLRIYNGQHYENEFFIDIENIQTIYEL